MRIYSQAFRILQLKLFLGKGQCLLPDYDWTNQQWQLMAEFDHTLENVATHTPLSLCPAVTANGRVWPHTDHTLEKVTTDS